MTENEVCVIDRNKVSVNGEDGEGGTGMCPRLAFIGHRIVPILTSNSMLKSCDIY